jgi:hypothetical protein
LAADICLPQVAVYPSQGAVSVFFLAAYLPSIEYFPGPVTHNSSKAPMIDTFL